MGTHKVKGLLKGLRYISQVFDEEKDEEIQIGAPTDVKHLAHIGCDGVAEESPSWMREFSTTGQGQSASQSVASDTSEAPSDGPDWVSEDSSQRKSRKERAKSKQHRRHRSMENTTDLDSQGKDATTKPRPTRRQQAKGGSCSEDPSARDESPDVPKKTRRKKPKEESGGGLPSRPSRSKAMNMQASDAE